MQIGKLTCMAGVWLAMAWARTFTTLVSFDRTAYAVLALCAATAMPGQTFTPLHSFDVTDGQNPYGGLVQAANGDFYGTTGAGGLGCSIFLCGTVYKITPAGALTTIYNFCSETSCADGDFPFAGLVQASSGELYGTTYSGGAGGASAANCLNPNSCGTVFKITPSGARTTLYNFCSRSDCTDGDIPGAALILAANGDLYGTTTSGGAGANCPYQSGCGTIFQITPGGTLTTLYSFCSLSGCTDGGTPNTALVQAADGAFYGTTPSGGTGAYCPYPGGCGTVFRITPSGALITLYSFCSESGCIDGLEPSALVAASNGAFYGTTANGGANGYGTVFEITPLGTRSTLYSFCSQSGCADGEFPVASLTQATDGNFYGTTSSIDVLTGARTGDGTIFKITPGGALTTLHTFDGSDGANPIAALFQGTDGAFYGTAEVGGANGDGTIFSLSVGLGPFVETQTTSGPVGANVNVLGTDLTGATRVTFNGTAAAFKVVSRYLIRTTVPTGATTGKVKVVTPSRTLTSNAAFRVP